MRRRRMMAAIMVAIAASYMIGRAGAYSGCERLSDSTGTNYWVECDITNKK